MYSATRSVITSQAEITTITVMNAVSTTNHIEMPSTPRWYWMLKRSIQFACSTNCIAAEAVSKWKISGSVTAKLTIAPNSAIQRTKHLLRSEPNINTTSPKKIGS